ncbi:hypothetical protein CHUAL_006482 [Chamberlinius hualienensis]
MRRLHRVALFLVAIISLIGFVLYKHEYDRLSNLLHVLHTFGQSSCNEQLNAGLRKELLANVPNTRLGNWQKFGPVFAYSAFWEAGTIKIFAVVPKATNLKDIKFGKCIVYHTLDDNAQQKAETAVSMEIEIFDSRNVEQWKTVYFLCKYEVSKSLPYSVSLSLGAGNPEKFLPSIPVTRIATLSPRSDSTNISIAICAPLTGDHFNQTSINQFIEFHSYIGINRIALYDFNASPLTLQYVNEAQKKDSDTVVHIFPWNFPSDLMVNETDSNLLTNMMKRDCMLRHTDQHYVVLLEMHQLVVPRLHFHLSNLMHDEQELDDSMGVTHLSVKTFCDEFQSDPYIKLLPNVFPMFVKSRWAQPDDEEKETTVIVNPRAIRGFTTSGAPIVKGGYHDFHMDSELAAFHTYRSCGANLSYAHFDNVVYRKFGNYFLPNFHL